MMWICVGGRPHSGSVVTPSVAPLINQSRNASNGLGICGWRMRRYATLGILLLPLLFGAAAPAAAFDGPPPFGAPRGFFDLGPSPWEMERAREYARERARAAARARAVERARRRAAQQRAAERNDRKATPLTDSKEPLQIVISIEKQKLTVYSGDVAVAESRVSTGTARHPTRTGLYSVIQKDRWHYSNLYDNAPMHYMHRLTWSGLALHSGVVPDYPASHGCIRLPGWFASRLWRTTKRGDRVIVVQGDVRPVAFTHPQLLALAQPPAPAAPLAIRDDHDEAPSPAAPAALGVSDAEKLAPAGAANGSAQGAPALRTTLPSAGTKKTGVENSNPLDASASKIAKDPRENGPVSIFISRKTKKLYVRQRFAPLFQAPVTIKDPEIPVGTHVFTVVDEKDGDGVLRWTAVSMPSRQPVVVPTKKRSKVRGKARASGSRKAERSTTMELPPDQSAGQALDRITIPADVNARIARLLSRGSSLVISDHGLGQETGEGTNFIVVTR